MPPKPKAKRACPTCFKTSDEDLDNCLNKSLKMCPVPEALVDDRSVEIVCAAPCGGPNGKHLACPIGNVMKRRQLTNLGTCAFDVCRARVVPPLIKVDMMPPPISGEQTEQFREWDREGIERSLDAANISQEVAERLLIEVDSADPAGE